MGHHSQHSDIFIMKVLPFLIFHFQFFSFSTQLSSFISGNSGILFDDDNLNS